MYTSPLLMLILEYEELVIILHGSMNTVTV
jgi:hypothetical protein